MKKVLFTAVLLLALGGCGGESEIGEDCGEVAGDGECVDGAICTNQGDDAVCLKICVDQSQCAATENCNGVSGSSIKSCQPGR